RPVKRNGPEQVAAGKRWAEEGGEREQGEGCREEGVTEKSLGAATNTRTQQHCPALMPARPTPTPARSALEESCTSVFPLPCFPCFPCPPCPPMHPLPRSHPPPLMP
ncbi:unnamed protein product, partial [Closterium sp. Naga37s-1]